MACDTAVLQMLQEDEYETYGLTLIHFAEKLSLTPFPPAFGLGGNGKQLRRRIANIASYRTPSAARKWKGRILCLLTALTLLAGFAPALPIYAADERRYLWQPPEETVTCHDFSAYFGDYEGSFVLYDLESDMWSIYNEDLATLRTSPDSTYKIYDALLGLEYGVITPECSEMRWDGTNYPIEAWNADQNLSSAMGNSVNWYFQSIDKTAGVQAVKNFIEIIGYGNRDLSGPLPSYWLESSLKISPVEQVELLEKFDRNDFQFAPDHVRAVKDAVCLYASPELTLYGKTGTGRVKGRNVNGWFIGYIEKPGRTWYFASNIRGEDGAAGAAASEIALSILSDLYIWE